MAKVELGVDLHPMRNILTNFDGCPMTDQRMADLVRDERKRLGLTEFDQRAWRYRGEMELA